MTGNGIRRSRVTGAHGAAKAVVSAPITPHAPGYAVREMVTRGVSPGRERMAVEALARAPKSALKPLRAAVEPVPRDVRRCAGTLLGARRHRGAGVRSGAGAQRTPAFGAR